MHGKLYVLLAILFVVTIASVYADGITKKNDAPTSTKKNKGNDQDKESGESEESTAQYSIFRPDNRKHIHVQFPSEQPQLSFPVPTSSNSNNGFTCNGLLDPQYPIFSDMCGAVPQARYALPNTFGHNDRWQIAHILTTLISSTTDAFCIRSLRHLLCPMLFQPCRVRHEPPLVLPCQYYCRAVKSQCGTPALDVIPCESLPYASDYCPSLPLASSYPSPPAPVATTNQPQAPGSAPSQTERSLPSAATKPATQQSTQPPAGQYLYRLPTHDYQIGAKYVPTYLSVKTPTAADYYAANLARYQTVPLAQPIKQ
ncbi:unnamed protein product [Rotaria magnacalcarata]|uniref:FZ domain-containing protein n=2 Tax=Rotaria magnacalcarata TaxID=392030 RepID=A0A815TIY7_9BILA|nr:unnamed protein product [Rotaria magnacalcarata]CAF1529549.1 unnamed protein product [Rotaria magnacalcarata]